MLLCVWFSRFHVISSSVWIDVCCWLCSSLLLRLVSRIRPLDLTKVACFRSCFSLKKFRSGCNSSQYFHVAYSRVTSCLCITSVYILVKFVCPFKKFGIITISVVADSLGILLCRHFVGKWNVKMFVLSLIFQRC